jgi:hypothetical protein
MARGYWSRWGRHTKGDTEGWSLEIGNAYRCAVVPNRRTGEPPTWDASINGGRFGTYPTREAAMQVIERELDINMPEVIRLWHVFIAARATGQGRPELARAVAATLDESVDEAIGICDGDAPAVVQALLVANAYLESEVERMRELGSRFYALGRVALNKESAVPGATGRTIGRK